MAPNGPQAQGAPAGNRSGLPPQQRLHHGGESLAGKIRTGFEVIVRDSGLPSDVTPHWMRHTAATWLMRSGVRLTEAATYLGMTVSTLEAHYYHPHPDYQADVAEKIQEQA